MVVITAAAKPLPPVQRASSAAKPLPLSPPARQRNPAARSAPATATTTAAPLVTQGTPAVCYTCICVIVAFFFFEKKPKFTKCTHVLYDVCIDLIMCLFSCLCVLCSDLEVIVVVAVQR